MGLLSWFKDRRRAKILSDTSLQDEVWEDVLAQHPILSGLDDDETKRLRELIVLFLAEKQILFKEGMEHDEGVMLSVAAQACLPILNLGFGWLDGWQTVFIVPEDFEHKGFEEVAPGAWLESEDAAAGEVMSLGSVALALPDIDASGWGDGYNVVIHEMAHKLDLLSGSFDGCPPLHEGMDREKWKATFNAAYSDLRLRVSSRARNKNIPMDEYGSENIVEFFAVATETFFETPGRLKDGYPDVYSQLGLFYKQDPAERILSQSQHGS
jgi:Mlc titration factor MtfA (ptsG expression regulator)